MKRAWNKYNLVDSQEKLEELDRILITSDGIPRFDLISIDTETNGLRHYQDVVIGFSLSVDSKSGWYIPLLTWDPDVFSRKSRKVAKVDWESYMEGQFLDIWTGENYPEDVTQRQWKPQQFIIDYLNRWVNNGVNLIMHNAPFDVLMIEGSFGFDLSDSVFCDTVLLKHIIDENSPNALKEIAKLWQKELGISADAEANAEQLELGASVIRNGGTYNARTKHVWRADLEYMSKYAISDTFLTMGVFEVGLQKLEKHYEPKHFTWFFEDEVMPLCREVVIPMKRRGAYIDVEYFKDLEAEVLCKLDELEDHIISLLGDKLRDFSIGDSIDSAVTKKALVEKIMEIEGLSYPQKFDKKSGVWKNTLAKADVKKTYQKQPHWLWGCLMGEDEIKYSEERLQGIKQALYEEKIGRRYHFNIRSDAHLRWLFCDTLGHSKTDLPQTDSGTPEKPIPSMAAEVLEEFFLKKYPEFVKPLMLFKKLAKLQGTYITGILNRQFEGRVYMDFLQAGTISGRFACRNPNMQNLPRVEEIDKCFGCGSKNIEVKHPIVLLATMSCSDCGHVEENVLCPSAIKAGFIAPPGYSILAADYSSLEPRIFAFISGDKKLKEVYWNNLDLYSKIYCDMFDIEGIFSADPKADNFLKKMDKSKRDWIKPPILSVPFGARGAQVAVLMDFKKTIVNGKTGKANEVLDVKKGNEFIKKYLDTYSGLRNFMLESETQAVTQGFVETIVGRRRHFLYAVPVYKMLCQAGLTIDEFFDIGRKKLETSNYSAGLNRERLIELSREIGFHMKDKKGQWRTWAYIKSMFKNEIDNSRNVRIQGLAAHITNMGMLRFAREAKTKNLNSFIFLQLHDEIGSYVKNEDLEQAKILMQDSMENNQYTALLDVAMIAEPLIAKNLKEAK